jgi:hypothetical protein
MVAAGHQRFAAEGGDRLGDPLVVGGDNHTIDVSCRRGSAIDVLDHRPAGNQRERLAGETGRLVSGGDDDDGCGATGMLGGSDREHVES